MRIIDELSGLTETIGDYLNHMKECCMRSYSKRTVQREVPPECFGNVGYVDYSHEEIDESIRSLCEVMEETEKLEREIIASNTSIILGEEEKR